MKRREFVVRSAVGSVALGSGHLPFASVNSESTAHAARAATRKILIAGGNFDTAFIRYMASLTGKPRPRICYLPTASADNPYGSVGFYRACAPLQVEPHVQESFIASTEQPKGWDEVFLSMDGIVCSGGNTLNQQAIWKAQGIDVILRQPGSAASCSAAPAPARCAGSRRAPQTRDPRSCRSCSAWAC